MTYFVLSNEFRPSQSLDKCNRVSHFFDLFKFIVLHTAQISIKKNRRIKKWWNIYTNTTMILIIIRWFDEVRACINKIENGTEIDWADLPEGISVLTLYESTMVLLQNQGQCSQLLHKLMLLYIELFTCATIHYYVLLHLSISASIFQQKQCVTFQLSDL